MFQSRISSFFEVNSNRLADHAPVVSAAATPPVAAVAGMVAVPLALTGAVPGSFAQASAAQPSAANQGLWVSPLAIYRLAFEKAQLAQPPVWHRADWFSVN